MKAPHLLRVEEGPERFAPLVEAARAAGLRVGWLELGADAGPLPETSEPPPASAPCAPWRSGEAATRRRQAARGASRSSSDLLREHFLGCALVLVRGEVEAPVTLSPRRATLGPLPRSPLRRVSSPRPSWSPRSASRTLGREDHPMSADRNDRTLTRRGLLGGAAGLAALGGIPLAWPDAAAA